MTGPDARGYWQYINQAYNRDIEIGRSDYSGNLAIATPLYQVEMIWDSFSAKQTKPVKVFDKINLTADGKFTEITDPVRKHQILTELTSMIEKRRLDFSAKTYGKMFYEPPEITVSAESIFRLPPEVEQKSPYELVDASGNNYADSVEQGDGFVTIHGRNNSNEPRWLMIFNNGDFRGFNGAELGIVETQFLLNSADILEYFGVPYPGAKLEK